MSSRPGPPGARAGAWAGRRRSVIVWANDHLTPWRGRPMRYGGIEAGGTKWVCAVADRPAELLETETFPTTAPGETLSRAIQFFTANGPVGALGVGAFGPVDIRPASPTWG